MRFQSRMISDFSRRRWPNSVITAHRFPGFLWGFRLQLWSCQLFPTCITMSVVCLALCLHHFHASPVQRETISSESCSNCSAYTYSMVFSHAHLAHQIGQRICVGYLGVENQFTMLCRPDAVRCDGSTNAVEKSNELSPLSWSNLFDQIHCSITRVDCKWKHLCT